MDALLGVLTVLGAVAALAAWAWLDSLFDVFREQAAKDKRQQVAAAVEADSARWQKVRMDQLKELADKGDEKARLAVEWMKERN
jgi:type II secretory pathway component PulJ